MTWGAGGTLGRPRLGRIWVSSEPDGGKVEQCKVGVFHLDCLLWWRSAVVVSCVLDCGRKMAESGGEDAQKFGIATEPVKTLVFNAPYSTRQKTNLRLTNNTAKTFYWRIKSTKVECYIPTPTGGVLKATDSVVVLVTCEPMPNPPSNDRLTVEYVDAPENAEKLDRTAFEGALAVNRRVVQVVGNE